MKRGLLPLCCWTIGLFFAAAAAPARAAPSSQYATYTATRYPVILIPGLFGFDTLFGVWGYWHNLVKPLQASGAHIYLAQVSPAQLTEVRGEQVLLQIKKIMAITGAEKVNLIGHSHGGLTARYAAGVAPELVASVTTIASPHRGAAMADYLIAHPQHGAFWQRWFVVFGQSVAHFIDALQKISGDNDFVSALSSLSASGTSTFNRRFAAGLPRHRCGHGAAGVGTQRFYSWTGIGIFTNPLDPSDAHLAVAARLYGGAANDGMVGQCSAHFGTVIRDDFALNHLDVINQTIGLISPRGASPLAIMRSHLNRLSRDGL